MTIVSKFPRQYHIFLMTGQCFTPTVGMTLGAGCRCEMNKSSECQERHRVPKKLYREFQPSPNDRGHILVFCFGNLGSFRQDVLVRGKRGSLFSDSRGTYQRLRCALSMGIQSFEKHERLSIILVALERHMKHRAICQPDVSRRW
jgi:hypothetical protein